jgi:hypothetical protein
MALPKTFSQFSPSETLAKRYLREWRDSQDYIKYEQILDAFNNGELEDRVRTLNSAYHCTRAVNYNQIIQHLHTITHLDESLANGENIVDAVASVGGRNLFCFGTMYCHHSNPQKYFGYSRDIHMCLQRLNKRDMFNAYNIKHDDLRKYDTFASIMRNLIGYYHLENLQIQEIDIMLKFANRLK